MLRERIPWGFLLCSGTAAILFLSILSHPFFYDDIFYVEKNPAIRSIASLPRAFREPFSFAAPGLYRPMTTVSYAVDFALFGANPHGFHATNILLHAIVSGLLFLLALRILRDGFGATVVALLFAAHPVHTEAVAWVSGRSELLAALFTFLCILSFAYSRECANKKRALFLTLSGFMYFLALASKEVAAPLPVLLLLIENMLISKEERRKESWKKRYAPYSVFVLALALYAFFRFSALGGFSVPLEHIRTAGLSFLDRMMLMAPVIAHYMKLMIFPVGLRIEYDWIAFPVWISLASFLFIVGMLALGVWFWTREKGRHTVAPLHAMVVGIFWFFLFLLPVSNIIPIGEIVAERFLYLPSAGFCLLMGALALKIRERFSLNPALLFLLLFLLPFSFLTVRRNAVWASPETVWESTLMLSPQAPHALQNLASIRLAKGDLASVGELLDRALARWPEDPSLLSLKAQWHLARGERDIGHHFLTLALERASPTTLAFTDAQRGAALLELGRFTEALAIFEHAVKKNPFDGALRNNLGIAQAQLGRTEEAKQSFARAIVLFEAQKSLSEEDQRNFAGAKANLDMLEQAF